MKPLAILMCCLTAMVTNLHASLTSKISSGTFALYTCLSQTRADAHRERSDNNVDIIIDYALNLGGVLLLVCVTGKILWNIILNRYLDPEGDWEPGDDYPPYADRETGFTPSGFSLEPELLRQRSDRKRNTRHEAASQPEP